MARATRSEVLRDFTGGLNLRRDQVALAENEFPYAINLVPDGRGGLTPRQDWKLIGLSGSRSVSLAVTADLFATAAATQIITAATLPYSWLGVPAGAPAANVYYHTITVGSDEPIITENSMGITSERTVGGVGVAQFGVLAYLARGLSLTGRSWSGSAAVALTASGTGQWQDSFATPTGTHMPQAEHVASHAGHLWVAATQENAVKYPNRVRFSHPGFPESWREDDFIDIPAGGPSIKGLIPFNDGLLVLKDFSIWAILGYDWETFQVIQVTDGIGCSSSRHAAVAGSSLYFVSWPEGVMKMGRDYGVDKVSEPLNAIFMSRHMNSYAFAWSSLSWSGGKLRYSAAIANGATIEGGVSGPFGSPGSQTVTAARPGCTFVYDPFIGANGCWWMESGCPTGNTNYASAGLICSLDLAAATQSNRRAVGFLLAGSGYAWVKLDSGTWAGDDWIAGLGPETYDTDATQRVIRTRWVDAGTQAWKKRFGRPEVMVREENTTFTYTWKSYRDWDESTQVRTGSIAYTGNDAIGTMIDRATPLGSSRAAQLLLTFPATGESGIIQVDFRYTPRLR